MTLRQVIAEARAANEGRQASDVIQVISAKVMLSLKDKLENKVVAME